MGVIFYDLSFLVVFSICLIIFLYAKRKNLKREGILYLYKTKLGIKFIDYIGKKFKRVINVLQYFSIVLGYFLMVGIFLLLISAVYTYIKIPIKTPPLVPLIPYFPRIFGVQSFFPEFYFTYFIVAILIVAVVHEFSHGIFAKSKGLKIKSTGFALLWGVSKIFIFFYNKFKKIVESGYAIILSVITILLITGMVGSILWYLSILGIWYTKQIGFILALLVIPLLGAFVEPDEKAMMKKSKKDQMAILSAGVFANLITAVIFVLIALLFLNLAFSQAGAVFTSYVATEINVADIGAVNDYAIIDANPGSILKVIEDKNIEDNLVVGFGKTSINLTEIKAGGKTYLTKIEILKSQLKANMEIIPIYGDFPALRAGLKGAITEINNVKIKN